MDQLEYDIEITKQKLINKKLVYYLHKLMSIEKNIEQWPVYRKKELKKEIEDLKKRIKNGNGNHKNGNSNHKNGNGNHKNNH